MANLFFNKSPSLYGIFSLIFLCFFSTNSMAYDLPSSVEPVRAGSNSVASYNNNLVEKYKDYVNQEEFDKFFNYKYPKGANRIRFILKGIDIEGSTVFDKELLEKFYDVHIGTSIRVSDVYYISQKITNLYRKQGYVLSKAYIPPQYGIEQGSVKIQILEGFVRNVILPEEVKHSSLVSNYAKKITESKPLNFKDLERFILLLNDNTGYNFSATLVSTNDTETLGAIDLKLDVAKKDNSTSISISNRGSRYLGPGNISATKDVYRIFSTNDSLEVSVSAAVPNNELKYGSFDYQTPVGSSGLKLGGGVAVGKIKPGYKLKSQQVDGKSIDSKIYANYPFIRSRDRNLYGNVELNNKRVSSDASNLEIYKDVINAVRLGVAYDNVDKYKGKNTLSTKLSQGLNIAGATNKKDVVSKAGADSDFTKVELNASRLQRLNEKYSAYIGFASQYSPRSLYSSEEFYYGGEELGKAYDNGEISGDSGVAGAIELRRDLPNIYSGVNLQPFLSYDAGKMWNNDIGAGDPAATSVAFGVRGEKDEKLKGSLTIAQPLSSDVSAPNSGNGKDPRFFARLNYEF